MDENYRIICRILRTLERAMDTEDFDWHCIGAESRKITEQRWGHIMEMLADEGICQRDYRNTALTRRRSDDSESVHADEEVLTEE